ncbi:hypothetical protein GCM10010495_26170 [Kitasatospora herbaricolor]|uniref:Uncharacterized protein n=1 Tax=Kitasatospora herbaricolor TaxID=68217 RepID=A0ABZ1W683_9ACTN|nr:hypothetical protein [Kitasatospora herbaricolor]MDQ0311182.1 hypothetical protein [Kitasatospora herbaricolor]GGV11519.1 hypothetical protein GCM10010495_26170 [Kitasatospora herbaricolor]
MEQGEVLKRVIGILTQAGEWLHEPDGVPEDATEEGPGVVMQLLNDVMPQVTIPADASAAEISTILSEELGGRIMQLTTAFAIAFWELAEVHDSGRTDVTALDVLQELALRSETDS